MSVFVLRWLACAQCFGDPSGLEARGLVWAGSVLLVCVAAVLFVIARLFLRLLRSPEPLADAAVLSGDVS